MSDELTQREQLVGMVEAQPEMMAAVLDDIVGPPLPPVALTAWETFGHLSGTRSSGMGGIGAITYAEMDAYQRLTGARLTPLDIALIREADAVFLSYAMQRMRKAEAPETTQED